MNEMLETFRDASAADLQAAGQAIARHEPQIFLRALHCLEVVQRITGVMREIDGEIDALIGR